MKLASRMLPVLGTTAVALCCCVTRSSTDHLTADEHERLRLMVHRVFPLVVQPRSPTGGEVKLRTGTAFPVASRIFRTAKHVLSPEITRVTLDGEDVEIRVTGHGIGESVADDWVEFVVASQSRAASAEPFPKYVGEISDGMRVYLVGCYLQEALYVFPGAVIPPPDWVPEESRTMLFIVAPHDAVYEGVSGGPVVAWNEARAAFAVIGQYRGAHVRTLLGLPWGQVHDAVPMMR